MLSLARLPWMNLRGYPVRTGTLVVFSMLMTMAMFGGTMLVSGIDRGLHTVESRLGAGLGVLVSGVLITSFSGLVRQTIGLGFLIPSLPVIAGLAAGAVAAMGLVALVSSWIALRALNTADASALLKEGE